MLMKKNVSGMYIYIFIYIIHKTDAHLFNYMLIHLSRVLLDSWIEGFMDIKKLCFSKAPWILGKGLSESDALIKKLVESECLIFL